MPCVSRRRSQRSRADSWAPVFCNVLWPTREAAVNASRGDIWLVFCNTCGHLFNRSFDPKLVEYTQSYENSLHYSARFQHYATELAQTLVERHRLYGRDIVEVGCGQGDFLRLLCDLGGNRGTGFDPSYRPDIDRNDTAEAVTIIRDLYGEAYYGYRADLVCCRQVLEHISVPSEFLASVRRLVDSRPEGVLFFEVPNVLYTIRDLGIWDIIYEHYSYFSPASLAYLFSSHGLSVEAVRETFGGQYLTIEATASPAKRGTGPISGDAIQQLAAQAQAFADNYREKVHQWRG
jgi:SAM-dependent methyltransferase